ncbi:MAG TPA: metallophosphoesterase [Kofleriaceae bacterium]|nr:metallophosphoesterase [Kofleriaceae bacterium]
MKILHLSDLHVTHDGRELNQLWGRARPAMAGQRFDFVVLSGDLTQRAAPAEYAKLKRFLEAEIEPLVLGDRATVKTRVVIVPGNHDVDWSADVFDTLALANARSDVAQMWFADGQWRPETQPYRVKTGAFGHTSAFQIRADHYHERFAAVQAFLSDYYGDQLVHPHRPFGLIDPLGTGSGDWQAHVFPELHVAILGFNSCYRNDRYWHGAQIHEDAITEARDHIDRIDHGRSFLRIGVWHHGLESHRSRPDRLTFENLTALVTSGIKVGFHGHVHKTHAQLHRLITDDFALVSTGTLGAASEDRPDAVANQFSIIDLHRNRLRVEVYESEGLGAYSAREDRRRFMYFDLDVERPLDISKPLRSWAAHVIRRVTLDPENGVARIEVEIDDLDLSEPIVLARVGEELCTAPDPTVMVDGQRLPVIQRQVGKHFEFRSDGWTPKHYRRMTWSYRVANAFALTRAELELSTKRDDYPHLLDGSGVWSHVVQFDYDRLTMEFILDAPDGDYFGSAGGVPSISPIVERRTNGGPLRWERLGSEETRATKLLASTRRCSVSWPSPMASARYGLMFPLASRGDPLPLRFAVATSRLVQLCRSTRRQGEALRATLATYLEASLKSSLELDADNESFGEYAVAVGNLWNAREQMLRPCFGFFPPDAWVTQFEAGHGIAGHAFRFARPAAWHRSIAGEFDVIKVPTMQGRRDYEWILCLPILTGPNGAAIGVFGFAGTREHNTETTNQLSAFAQQIAQREPSVDTEAFDRFWYVLNASFWFGLADAAKTKLLDRGVIDMADECSRAFVATGDPDDPDPDDD